MFPTYLEKYFLKFSSLPGMSLPVLFCFLHLQKSYPTFMVDFFHSAYEAIVEIFNLGRGGKLVGRRNHLNIYYVSRTVLGTLTRAPCFMSSHTILLFKKTSLLS